MALLESHHILFWIWAVILGICSVSGLLSPSGADLYLLVYFMTNDNGEC